MRRGAILAPVLVLAAAYAVAQTPPAAPIKPTVAKPIAPKPPVVERAKPAAAAQVTAFREELKTVDLAIGKLQSKNNGKDPISELNKEDMAQLQAMMKRKGQLEQMISNAMKAGSDTGSSIIANPKGS
jgi:TolA-binding protein